MRARLVFAAATIALAALAGTARADTVSPAQSTAAVLPSSVLPNDPATLVVPPDLTTPPAQPEQLTAAQLQDLWQRAGAAYGIPWSVLAAINKVESDFGRNMGPSSAGAVGWMQFMPSTWLRWGMDGNGDGVADPWNAEDAMFSAARYLAASGGSADISTAVFSYNHADWYVREVLDIARLYDEGGVPSDAGSTDVTFQLDRLQQQLEAAQDRVADVNRQFVAAQEDERQLAQVAADWEARAQQAPVLSDRLAAEQQAALADVRRDQAQAQVDQLRTELGEAQDQLDKARADSRAAAFDPGAGTLLQAPSYTGNWVFPVGGGAGIVAVSQTHHDYPAADIAAPAGSPVYAIGDAVVVNAWQSPDARCGIGVTMQTGDGQVWTYCHLSYLEPTVVDGASLAAGAPVGLVGATGDATGPHLHLQLQPATTYPQDEGWFRSFAGTAFRWSDSAPARPLATAGAVSTQPAAAAPAAEAAPSTEPVFAVVPATPEPPAVLFTR
jgi:murein DD-endopeptidase MepM/ murein hydrolase activator NlpD